MAVPAATTTFVLVLVSVAVVTVVATAAVVAEVVQHVLNLAVRCLAVLKHQSSELQRLSSQRMVGVDGDTVVLNFQHTGHEALVVLVHQGNDGTGVDVLVIEVVVDAEHLALHLVDTLLVVVAESLVGGQREVEGAARQQVDDATLKSIKRHAEATDKLEGVALLRLLLKVLVALGIDGVQLIAD